MQHACVDTFTPSYQSLVVHSAGAVVAKKEAHKEEKYAGPAHSHHFVPVAVETTGVIGACILAGIKELERHLDTNTREKNSMKYLWQRLLIVVQWGNGYPFWDVWTDVQ